MSNFTVRLSGKVSGFFVAAPDTNVIIADRGGMNPGTTYLQSDTPDVMNGDGGSNGCAFTSGDRIIDGTTYSNDTFTLTLGDRNASNSTDNNILVELN